MSNLWNKFQTKPIALLLGMIYGISREWLLDGTGEIYVPSNPLEKKLEEENSLLRKIDKSPLIKEIVEHLTALDNASLAQILAIAKTFSKK